MEKFVLREKSFDFSLRCVKLFKYLCETEKEYVLSKQFLRSGTAVGALIVEAKYAESKPDFIHKYAIALKECNEPSTGLNYSIMQISFQNRHLRASTKMPLN